MAEIKLPRLLAAAKEFNIGQDTLIDFLIGKSFPKDELKPTSKLTEAMYKALQQEFQSDKAAKMKSDQVDLPKGSQEAKKKKDVTEENKKHNYVLRPHIPHPHHITTLKGFHLHQLPLYPFMNALEKRCTMAQYNGIYKQVHLIYQAFFK